MRRPVDAPTGRRIVGPSTALAVVGQIPVERGRMEDGAFAYRSRGLWREFREFDGFAPSRQHGVDDGIDVVTGLGLRQSVISGYVPQRGEIRPTPPGAAVCDGLIGVPSARPCGRVHIVDR